MGSSSSKSSNTNTRSRPKNIANGTSSESRPTERPNPTEKTSKPTVHPVHIPSPEHPSNNPPAYSSSRQSEYIQPSSYINKFTNQTLVGPMLPLRLLLSSYNNVSQYSYEELESQFILSKYHSRKLQGIDLAHYLQHIHSFCPDTSPLHVSLATVCTRFPLIRGVARDGDCFYRSVLVILVEQLRYLSLFNPPRAISLLKHIATLKRYVVEVSGELCDDLWDVFIETLTTAAGVSYVDFVDALALEQRRADIIAADQAVVASDAVADNGIATASNDAIDASIAPSAPVDNVDDNVDNVERPVTMITVGAPQSTPWMHAFQNEPHRALSSISMLRLLTSARLRHDPELQLYVDEEIEFHCKTQVSDRDSGLSICLKLAHIMSNIPFLNIFPIPNFLIPVLFPNPGGAAAPRCRPRASHSAPAHTMPLRARVCRQHSRVAGDAHASRPSREQRCGRHG